MAAQRRSPALASPPVYQLSEYDSSIYKMMFFIFIDHDSKKTSGQFNHTFFSPEILAIIGVSQILNFLSLLGFHRIDSIYRNDKKYVFRSL